MPGTRTFERLPRIAPDAAAAAIGALAPAMTRRGAPLYAALCERVPHDPELVAIASHGLATSTAMQLFAAVQYLLLGDPNDPLAEYYANLTDQPAPPEEAFPAFARFCKAHSGEIVRLICDRTVQATTPERCKNIMPPLSRVAQSVGEPLHLIEIGCSAGVLLTFDKYAYDLGRRGRLGAANAPLTLSLDLRAGPDPHIPRVGRRIGLDLCLIDLKSEDERRWAMAQCFPERHEWRRELATALDVIANTDISFHEGDALDVLPALLAETPDPLCVYHSACLLYWTEESKAELEGQLLAASRGREIHRVAVERRGQSAGEGNEIVVSRYRDGADEERFHALPSFDFDSVTWVD